MGLKTAENVTSMCPKVAFSVVLLLQKKGNLYLEFIYIYLYLPLSDPPGYRFPEGQTGKLRRGLLPGRHPPDHRRSRALPDTLGGGQA